MRSTNTTLFPEPDKPVNHSTAGFITHILLYWRQRAHDEGVSSRSDYARRPASTNFQIFARLDFKNAYVELLESLRADPCYAWRQVVNHASLPL